MGKTKKPEKKWGKKIKLQKRERERNGTFFFFCCCLVVMNTKYFSFPSNWEALCCCEQGFFKRQGLQIEIPIVLLSDLPEIVEVFERWQVNELNL